MLKTYHRSIMKSKKSTSRKSVTLPKNILSMRLPNAPLRMRVKLNLGIECLVFMNKYMMIAIATICNINNMMFVRFPSCGSIPKTAP